MGGKGMKWKTGDRQRLARTEGMQCRQPICLGVANVHAHGSAQACQKQRLKIME